MKNLLSQSHLSILAQPTDGELQCIANIVEHHIIVDGRSDLEIALGTLLAQGAPPTAKTLDLIGHATPGKSLLSLGEWVIDIASPTVSAYFRELADHDVFERLGITGMRLLGCRTADTSAGRATIVGLAELLGIDVYGTRGILFASHYTARGFSDDHRYLLVSNRDLEGEILPEASFEPWPQALDIDVLPSSSELAPTGPWPHRAVSEADMAKLLRHVRRRDGAMMPGLLAAPQCELVFPGHAPGTYRRAQVVLGGEFVRFYPRGNHEPGIVFAVDDPHSMLALVESLPAVTR